MRAGVPALATATLVTAAIACGGRDASVASPGDDAGGDAADAASEATSDTGGGGDAGSCDGGPTPVQCPSDCIIAGKPCTGSGECDEWLLCGRARFACCGTWVETSKGASCGDCPASEPAQGGACSQQMLCLYTPAGGKFCQWDTVTCGNEQSNWSVQKGEGCTYCPPSKPADGDACSVEGKWCFWVTQCHSQGSALCSNGKWKVGEPCP